MSRHTPTPPGNTSQPQTCALHCSSLQCFRQQRTSRRAMTTAPLGDSTATEIAMTVATAPSTQRAHLGATAWIAGLVRWMVCARATAQRTGAMASAMTAARAQNTVCASSAPTASTAEFAWRCLPHHHGHLRRLRAHCLRPQPLPFTPLTLHATTIAVVGTGVMVFAKMVATAPSIRRVHSAATARIAGLVSAPVCA